jgi:hypothetical protein
MAKYDINLENVKKGICNPDRVFDEVILEYSYRTISSIINSNKTIGTNIYNRDWDVLIVLDTCRVDALRLVASDYDFIEQVDSIQSVGGASGEWVARTFDKSHLNEIQKTAYLTANAHVQQILDDRTQETDRNKHLNYKTLRLFPTVDISDLSYYEYLFQYERWGEKGPLGHTDGMTPPRYVTERAIDIGRKKNYDRMVIHYFQPHSPWVASALNEGRELEQYEEDWWNYLTETGDVDSVWNAYIKDLRYVLNDIALLLNNLDEKRVILTADHGEAFGEYNILGHKIGSLHPKVRNVPWVEATGKDKKTYLPTIEPPKESNTMSTDTIEEQLSALGYKT